MKQMGQVSSLAMIGRLKGLVAAKDADGAVIDVNGVGYEVSVPLTTLASLPGVGDETILWIHTHVREEELRLFGFLSKRDRTAFRTLLKVNGVGPKLALAVLGALDGPTLSAAVSNGDTKRLSSIPGIGKKTAERMILELGGRLSMGAEPADGSVSGGVFAQLDSALVNLGFKPQAVQKVIAEVRRDNGEDASFPILLKQCLSLLQGR